MSGRGTIAVISGGLSFEREVSLRSGRRVEDALRAHGYQAFQLDADETLVRRLRKEELDAVFMALHGRHGEDGTVPSILELLGVPFTGSGFEASRLAFDKLTAKGIMAKAGLRTPEAIPFPKGALQDLHAASILDEAIDRLGLPLVVKPNRGGSALGVQIVERAADIASALLTALSYDDTAILERHVSGTEVAVVHADGLQALPAVKIHPVTGRYDFAAKYSYGATEFTVPVRLPADITEHVQTQCREAHWALGCRDVSRVDAIVDGDGTCWVLEVNTSPGLTGTSVVPAAVEAAGISFSSFVAHMTERALARRPR